MNKQQLAEELSSKVAGTSRAQAEKLLDVMTRTITEKLRAGEDVVLAGFGAFSAKKRKGRVGVNPRNVQEKIEIPAVTVAKFKPGKKLKDSLKRVDRPLIEEESTEGHEPVEEEETEEPVEESPAEATEPVEEERA
ncbi:HU family DNA-binding protein [Patescibacteria group bacterium]|nr:HU family DNA-binding protein [Patescibacteria group bacterium]